jgi:hypothetical protein
LAPVEQIARTFPLPDHLREEQTEFRRAHRTSQRNQHLAARIEVLAIGFRGINQCVRIEVTEVMEQEAVMIVKSLEAATITYELYKRDTPWPLMLADGRIVVTGGAGFIGSALVWGLNRLGLNRSEKWRNPGAGRPQRSSVPRCRRTPVDGLDRLCGMASAGRV